MKKTLVDEQKRIVSLIKELHGTGYPRGKSEYQPEPIDNEKELEDALRKCISSGKSIEEVRQKVEEILDELNSDLSSEEDIPFDPEKHSAIHAGGTRVGIPESELQEGNAFIAAANKAKEDGKDTFELGGKTYDVKK